MGYRRMRRPDIFLVKTTTIRTKTTKTTTTTIAVHVRENEDLTCHFEWKLKSNRFTWPFSQETVVATVVEAYFALESTTAAVRAGAESLAGAFKSSAVRFNIVVSGLSVGRRNRFPLSVLWVLTVFTLFRNLNLVKGKVSDEKFEYFPVTRATTCVGGQSPTQASRLGALCTLGV